jgi:hypothetical protein
MSSVMVTIVVHRVNGYAEIPTRAMMMIFAILIVVSVTIFVVS